MQVVADMKICRRCKFLAWNVGNRPWVQVLCAGLDLEKQAEWKEARRIKAEAEAKLGYGSCDGKTQHDTQTSAIISIEPDGSAVVLTNEITIPSECPFKLEYMMKSDETQRFSVQ